MKKRLVSVLLALVMCLSFAIPAFAAGDVTDEYIGEEVKSFYWDVGFTESYFDGPGNMYTGYVFSTLTEAKMKFGYEWEYGQCNVSYGGHSFNCFYIFTDKLRCYFNVDEFDFEK